MSQQALDAQRAETRERNRALREECGRRVEQRAQASRRKHGI